ncbi:MAG: DUF6502 family protein [Woeseiaceae bacterium]|nr:DUF6502 family protein [Woeseiaceae bacterium]
MDNENKKLRSVVFVAIRHLAKVLLRGGMNAKEFGEIAKLAFVEASADELARPERAAPTTEVARQTGLTRADVKRLRDKLAAEKIRAGSFTPSDEGECLHRWHTDLAYLDESGNPRPLEIGPGAGTLLQLIADSCEADPARILTHLEDGHITRDAAGTYLPVRRDYKMPQSEAGLTGLIDSSVSAIAKTISNNIDCADGRGWIQRVVYSDQLGDTTVPVLRQAVRSRATSFCEEIDDLFAAHSVEREDADDPAFKAGIGVFYFEDE